MTPDPSYRLVHLTRGQVSIVDAADYDRLSLRNWCSLWNPGVQSYYAYSNVRTGGRHGVVYMHREILGLLAGDPLQGDHINHDTLDNRRSNLRVCSRQQNAWNTRNHSNSTTGLKGISKWRNGWRYSIRIEGKRIHSRAFPTPEEAILELLSIREIHHRDFSCSG